MKVRGQCLTGVGDDGDGTFLLGYMADHGDNPTFPEALFFQIQNGKAVRVGGTVLGGDDSFNPVLFSQPTGFTVYGGGIFGGVVTTNISTWSHDGVLV